MSWSRAVRAIRGLPLVALWWCSLALLAGPATGQEDGADPSRRPGLLVTGFTVTGNLLEGESEVALGLSILTEAILADAWQPVSAAELEGACERVGCYAYELPYDPGLRLAVSRELGVAACLTGWACSFGERIVLIVEVIEPAKGLPGRVYRATCDGLERMPFALELLLESCGPPESEEQPAPVAAAPELPDDELLEIYPNDAYRELVVLREDGALPPDAKIRKRADELLAATRAHARRLRDDPDYRNEWIVRTNFRLDPVFAHREFDVHRRGPYLMFVEQVEGHPVLPDAAAWCADLEGLYDRFHERFGEPLSLDRLEERRTGTEQLLPVVVMRRRVRTEPRIGQSWPEPPFLGSYHRASRRLMLRLDPVRAMDQELSSELRSELLYLATYQLLHYYAKFSIEADRDEEIAWDHRDLSAPSLWLSEGLAGLMAKAAGPDRVEDWRKWVRADRRHWTLPELLSTRTRGELKRQAQARGPGSASVFYAEAGAFCHFLYHHQDLRYRRALLYAMQRSLTGEDATKALSQALEGGDGFSWDALEAEWLSAFLEE